MSKIYTEFPEFIYEALITQVDYESGTCTLSPLSPDLNDLIRNVPLPHHLGASNSGIFHGLEIGSRVVAVQTAGNGRDGGNGEDRGNGGDGGYAGNRGIHVRSAVRTHRTRRPWS